MKSPALRKAHLEALVGAPFAFRDRAAPEFLPTGVAALDALTSGAPRGAITDIYGPASSGRTSLLLSMLAEATAREECCALIDTSDALDPASAGAAGIDLDRLLWVRCGGRADHALKAADMLVAAGGFGLIVFDLGDITPQTARRIPIASWFRFRRALENTPAALVVIEREPTVKSCASLMVEMRQEGIRWSGAPGVSRLLRGVEVAAAPRKPVRSAAARFEAQAG